MKKAMACRKRPCRICNAGSVPNPRLKDRQMTCGEESCKREWHRRKCAQWNRENSEPIKKERLAQKLKAAAWAGGQTKLSAETPLARHPCRAKHLLPWIQEVITVQVIIMLDYLVRHPVNHAQEVDSQATLP